MVALPHFKWFRGQWLNSSDLKKELYLISCYIRLAHKIPVRLLTSSDEKVSYELEENFTFSCI